MCNDEQSVRAQKSNARMNPFEVTWEEIGAAIDREYLMSFPYCSAFSNLCGRDCFLKTDEFKKLARHFVFLETDDVQEILNSKPWLSHVLHLRLLFARDYAFSMARKERPRYAGVVIADKIVEMLTETWDLYGLEWLAVDRAGLPLYYSGIDEDLRKVAREQMRREQALRIEGDFYIN